MYAGAYLGGSVLGGLTPGQGTGAGAEITLARMIPDGWAFRILPDTPPLRLIPPPAVPAAYLPPHDALAGAGVASLPLGG